MKPGSEMQKKVVGYWFNDKKCQKFITSEFEDSCRRKCIELIKIDIKKPLKEQGPFHLILHKLTAMYARAFLDDEEAIAVIEMFTKYTSNQPDVLLLDSMLGVQQLLLRADTYQVLCQATRNQADVFSPPYVKLTSINPLLISELLQKNSVTFPVVCKPLYGGGGKSAHELALVFNESQILEFGVPCIAQSFVNHGAILYKLYVLGPAWYIDIRPSLKNLDLTQSSTAIQFNSHEVSKSNCCSSLTYIDSVQSKTLPHADASVFQRIVMIIREVLQMDLLGIDVVIDIDSGKYAIIDLNFFPGYDGIPDLKEKFASFLRDRLDNGIPVDMMKEGKKFEAITNDELLIKVNDHISQQLNRQQMNVLEACNDCDHSVNKCNAATTQINDDDDNSMGRVNTKCNAATNELNNGESNSVAKFNIKNNAATKEVNDENSATNCNTNCFDKTQEISNNVDIPTHNSDLTTDMANKCSVTNSICSSKSNATSDDLVIDRRRNQTKIEDNR